MKKQTKIKAEEKQGLKKAVVPRAPRNNGTYSKILEKAGGLEVGKTLRLTLPEGTPSRVFINRLGVALRYAASKKKVALEKGYRFAMFATDDLKHVALSKVEAKKRYKKRAVK